MSVNTNRIYGIIYFISVFLFVVKDEYFIINTFHNMGQIIPIMLVQMLLWGVFIYS